MSTNSNLDMMVDVDGFLLLVLGNNGGWCDVGQRGVCRPLLKMGAATQLWPIITLKGVG